MRPSRAWLAGVLAVLAGCGEPELATPPSPFCDVERGRLLLRQYGCGTCHRISGVADAHGDVGPPLDGVAKRVYLGGVLPNSPENMVRWIRAPQDFDPRTVMPNLQVSERFAQDMTAYLYQLR